MKRSGATVLFLLLAIGCGGSGVSVTVLLNPTGMGSSTRMAPSFFGRVGPVPVTVDVRNESGVDATVEEILVVIMDSQGRTQARTTLAKQQLLQRGESTTYRGVLSGEWSGDSVLGVWTRGAVAGRPPGRSGSCTPLHLSRESEKLQRACERLGFGPQTTETLPGEAVPRMP